MRAPGRVVALAFMVALPGPLAAEPAGAPEEEGAYLRVTAIAANVRAEPSTEGRFLYQVRQGGRLTPVKKAGSWWLAAAPGQPPGYVRGDLVEVVAPVRPAVPAPPPKASSAPPPAPPAAPSIEHAPLTCVRPDENPLVNAGVTAAATVRRSRVYFKSHEFPDWYYVDMRAPTPPQYLALLPQPLPETRRIDYYVQAVDSNLESSQTREYDPQVDKKGCKLRRLTGAERDAASQLIVGGTRESQLPLPPGFSPKGIIAFVTAAGTTVKGAALARGATGTTSASTGPAVAGVAGPVPRTAAGAGASTNAVPLAAKTGGHTGLLLAIGGGIAAAGVGVAVAGGGGGDSGKPEQQKQDDTDSVSYDLALVKQGGGTGAVTSADGRIDCGATCTARYTAGTSVQLTATAAAGSAFTRWGGDASACGSASQCTLTVDSAKSVAVTFDPAPVTRKKLYVLKKSEGTGGIGTVTSGDGKITCGVDCTQVSLNYDHGARVTLNASAGLGSTFRGFTGSCGSGVSDCVLIMDRDQDVTATFDSSQYRLLVSLVERTGSGARAGITTPYSSACGAGQTCAFAFPAGTNVTLSACHGTNSFLGWSGDVSEKCPKAASVAERVVAVVIPPCSYCAIAMDRHRAVTAYFGTTASAGRPPEGPGATVALRLESELALVGTIAQVLVNGETLALVRSGRSQYQVRTSSATTRVNAQVIQGEGRSGTWRFELQPGAIVPGSLRVQQGEVLLLTTDSVVFRLEGRSGEAVAFTFAVKGSSECLSPSP